jgi:hypothetical protein
MQKYYATHTIHYDESYSETFQIIATGSGFKVYEAENEFGFPRRFFTTNSLDGLDNQINDASAFGLWKEDWRS